MGNYQDIVDILERSVPEYSSLKIVPRGTPIFPDLLMTGALKFGRRLGANFSVINPDNQVQLVADAPVQTQTLSLTRTLAWFEAGALLSFNTTEMLVLEDWDPDQNTITLSAPLTTARSAGDTLTLWATPLVLHFAAKTGDAQVTVRSRYNLLNGDVVTFPVSPLVNSLTEREVLISQNGGASGDTDYPYLFSLTLNQNLPIDLPLGSPIYLRAYPGYLSNTLSVPKLRSGQMGPFLLDYVGSPLDSVPSYREIFSVRTLSSASLPILGTASSLVRVAKNYPVVQRPISAENMVFWQVVRGSGGFISPNTYRLITDADGRGRIFTRIVPSMPPGGTWTLNICSPSAGTFRFYVGPTGGFQDYTLAVNTPQAVTLTFPAGGQVDRIEILTVLEEPGAQVTISDASYVGPFVATFQYGLVAQVMGTTNYQATSVIVKPYFLSLTDLTQTYDGGGTYDGGLIYG